MNISSVVIKLKANANKQELSDFIASLCQIVASEDDKIVAIIESDDINGQIRVFRALENNENISEVAMIYNYEELDNDIIKAQNNDIANIVSKLEKTPSNKIKYSGEPKI